MYKSLVESIASDLLVITPPESREKLSLKWGHFVLSKILKSITGANWLQSHSNSPQSSGSEMNPNLLLDIAPPPTSVEVNHTKNFVGAIVEKIRRIPDGKERERIRIHAIRYYWKMRADLAKKDRRTGPSIVTTWLMKCKRANPD